MTRPRLLDLYCGGGGAAMGYWRAGFDVVGVDIVRQPDYPFAFEQANALTYPLDGFDAIHASPPCQHFTTAGSWSRQQPRLFDVTVDELTPTLARFARLAVPWIVENVVGAPMPAGAVMLCGSSFGLPIRRHRLFASNVELTGPPCDHGWQRPIFPSMASDDRRAGKLASVIGVYGSTQGMGVAIRRAALGIDWLPNDRLTQAIPPAYTELLGGQLLAALS